MTLGNLKVEGGLDLEATLYSGQAFRWIRGPDSWHRGFIGNEPVAVSFHDGVLRWRGGPRISTPLVRHYFRLDNSHQNFLLRAPADPFLQTALARFAGLRLLRQDPWETFISFLISQNSNEAKIRRTIEALCRRAGARVHFGGEILHRFPTPARLAGLNEVELRETGMGYRAPFVSGAASAVAGGILRPRTWSRRPYDEAFEELLRVHGIGEKVADCILLYGCDQLRAFPSDVWVRRFVKETYLRRARRSSHEAIRDFAWRHFGPEAGYAQHYLFHYRRRVGELTARPA